MPLSCVCCRLMDAALLALRGRPGGVDVGGLGPALQALVALSPANARAAAVVEAVAHAAAARAERLGGKVCALEGEENGRV